MPDSLSATAARALALRAQHFDSAGGAPVDILARLGAIQLDSVNVLTRNHLLVPFARLGPYDVAGLHTAIYQQKQGFEYWGHMASWLPIEEYRYFLPRQARFQAAPRSWWAQVRAEHAALYPAVLDRIRAEGPLGAVAFEDPRANRGTWWDWKPAKLVLEDLFDQGLLMTAARTAGFARLYDLTARVLPAGLDTRDPGVLAATRHLLRRGLDSLGIATAAEMADYFRLRPVDQVKQALAELLAAGEVIPLAVDGWPRPAYSTAAWLAQSAAVPAHRPTFLAPFDNLLWARDRVQQVFDFHYRVEIYVPEARRQYGYYVLPLLARGEIRGRADLKLDRQAGVLRVRGLWLTSAEPEEATHALQDLATHLGAAEIDLPA